MNKTISLTVDTDDYNALTRASDMLHGMAQDAKKETGCTGCKEEKPAPAKSNIDDKEVEIDIKREDYSVETSAADAFAADTDDKPAIPDNMGTPGAIPGTVELDSHGLPWDVRIHSKNKSKLAKDQSWKKKRGVDPALVAQVEAELRAAMAAPGPATVETPATPATVETPATPATVETPATPAPAPVTAALTFPDLMGKITKAMGDGTVTNDRVTEVLNSHGLASLPLLAARPDLIPAINAELFPNG